MAKKLNRMAIAYDFDGTLAPGNMQEHSFIPNLGMVKEEFWKEVKAYARGQDMDEILAYMRLMVHKANYLNISITKESFRKHGRGIQFFPGVEGWFVRLDSYAKSKGIRLEHYIISSGLREMIEGTSIYKKFEYVFASGFAYDKNEVAVWPALAVNYTNKTQHLFRINRGIENAYDNATINKVQDEAGCYVSFENTVYIGDGETDVPCMSLLRSQGGTGIAVYNPQKRKTKRVADSLIENGCADFSVPADYREGQGLDQIMKALIDRAAANECLHKIKRGGRLQKVIKESMLGDAGREISTTADVAPVINRTEEISRGLEPSPL